MEAALREVMAETAESMIARQRSILFDIQRANYAAAASGDVDAARLIIATLEREARLFGLDAPTRVNVGVSDVEFAERTASLIESLGLTPPKELLRYSAPDTDVMEDGPTYVDVDVVADAADDGALDAALGVGGGGGGQREHGDGGSGEGGLHDACLRNGLLHR